MQLTAKLFWLRFLFDLLIYGLKVWLIINVTQTVGDKMQYILMGVMFVKEVYIYFACVKRAEAKMSKESFDIRLKGGLQNMLINTRAYMEFARPHSD